MTRTAVFAIAFATFAVLVLAPVAGLLVNIFWIDGSWALGNVASVLTDARQWTLLGNTLFLGLTTAALTFAIGAPVGFLLARTNVPGRNLLRPLMAAPILMPPLIHAIAWTEQVRVRGAIAAIGIFTLAYFPFVMILTARAVERIDGRLEEAALLAGGRRLWARFVMRLTLPPACAGALCGFLFVVSDFSVPDFLSSIGPKLNVYADEIFTRWQRQGDPGGAVAAAVPPALISVIGLLLISKLRGGRLAVTVGGNFAPPRCIALGLWRWPAFAWVLTILAFSLLAPLASLIWTMGSIGVLLDSLGQAREDILQTLLTATAAAAIATVVAFFLAHGARRSRIGMSSLTDTASAFALALPGIAFAIALIRIWNHHGLLGFVYTSSAVVMVAFAGRYFLFAHVSASGGLAALDPSLEESASLAGLGYLRRATTISARLAAPSLATGFLLVYIFAMRELDTIVLIPAGNRSAMFRIYNAIHFNRPQFVAALCLSLSILTVAPLLLYTAVLGRKLDIRP